LRQEISETPEQVQIETVYDRRDPQQVPNIDLTVEIASAQSDVEVATRQIARLETQLADCRELSQNFAPIRQEYEQILAKLTKREQDRAGWQSRYREVEMALEAERAKRRTHHESVLAAQHQYRPSSPSLLMILGFALAGGLAFGGGLVFVVHWLDRSINTPEQAAREFDVPVQGVIGEIVTPRRRVFRGLRRWVAGPVISLIVLAVLAGCALNVVLWLQYPDEHRQWRRAPIQFVRSVVNGEAITP